MSIHVGIFGPSLFGKSHVAKWLSREFAKHGRRSIVHDANCKDVSRSDWPDCCLVFNEIDGFQAAIWRHEGCAVFFDEASDYERDKRFNPLFTRIRHNKHLLVYIGHSWTDALPKQRKQLGTVFLFNQDMEPAKFIANEWGDGRLLDATTLVEYEFLYCKKLGDRSGPVPRHLITRGRFPA